MGAVQADEMCAVRPDREAGGGRAGVLVAAALLAGVLSSGCGAVLQGSSAWERGAAYAFLPAAEEAPPQKPAPPAPLEALPPPRDRHFGLRFGYMMPGERAEWDFQPSGVLGVYGLLREDRVTYELGLDVAITRDEDELYDSYLFSGRFDALFELTRREARWRGYLHCGLGMMLELAVELGSGYIYGNAAGALDFGAGAAFLDGLLDVRATYCVLLDSHNAEGLTLLMLGVSF